jgi:hypothetical protein
MHANSERYNFTAEGHGASTRGSADRTDMPPSVRAQAHPGCEPVPRCATISYMTEDGAPEAEAVVVAVRTPAGDAQWTLTSGRDGRTCLLTLTSPDRTWVGVGPDCFKALRDLRRRLDADGILLGINGARPNSWSSGMQCDMGEGRVTYLLELGSRGRPPQVQTLDAAPLGLVGTVLAQDEFQSKWRSEREP